MAALPEPTSICDTSHRWGRVQCYPVQKLPVAHQQQSGTRGRWKFCEGRDPVTIQLQYHMRVVHCQPTAWLKVDWKACLIHYQNSTNPLTQGQLGQPAQTPQMEGSKLTIMHLFHQGEAWEQWRMNPHGVLEFCITVKWHPSQCFQYFGFPMHLLLYHLMHGHGLHGEYSVRTLYSNHHKSVQHTQFLALMGLPSMSTVWMILDGGMDQRIFGQSAAAPLAKPRRQIPTEALWVYGHYNPEDGGHGRIIKKQMQNLAQCINGGSSIMIY